MIKIGNDEVNAIIVDGKLISLVKIGEENYSRMKLDNLILDFLDRFNIGEIDNIII